jgi:hypothetical protein
MAPPFPSVVDLMDQRLRQRYPSAKPRGMADLMATYWADPANGNNQGRPKGGDALWAHWGGTAVQLADRQFDFWKNRGPV